MLHPKANAARKKLPAAIIKSTTGRKWIVSVFDENQIRPICLSTKIQPNSVNTEITVLRKTS